MLGMPRNTKFTLMQSLSSDVDRNTVRLVANNTLRYLYPDESIGYSLHGTEVVRLYKNGTVLLNSGGYRTVTTKDRINTFLPSGIRLSQDRCQWFISRDGERVSFFDGMKIHPKKPLPVRTKVIQRDNKFQKQIAAYCSKLGRMIDKGFDCKPTNGDCWYCMMTTTEGKSLGDASGDLNHLKSHLKEKYVMGSLVVRAMEWCGQSQGGMYLMLSRPKDFRGMIVRYVRKYLRGKFGLVGGSSGVVASGFKVQ